MKYSGVTVSWLQNKETRAISEPRWYVDVFEMYANLCLQMSVDCGVHGKYRNAEQSETAIKMDQT